MHNAIAHYLPVDAQPVPKQWPPWPVSPLVYLLRMTSYDMEHPFGHLGPPVPVMSTLIFFCTPSSLAGGVVRNRKGLDSV